MKVLLPTVGSAGDVHPFLAVGQAMKSRGHDIEVMTNPAFEKMVNEAGLKFYPVGEAAHYADAFASPKLWHPVHGFGVFWRRMARYALEPVYARIANHAKDGRCVVMATPLMLGARLANEKLNVPLVTAYTAATMLRSCDDPLTMAHWQVPKWVPHAARVCAWWALDRWKLHPMIAQDLPRFRRQLGLPILNQSVFGQWIHSPVAGITMFPHWFAPSSSDWPKQVKHAGFPLYDGDTGQGLDADLLQFLSEGDKPIVFTPGSAMVHGHLFFKAAQQACIDLGRRGVFLTPHAGQIPADLPPTIHASRYAPLSLLLPKSLAVVHHGGVGTCAQALRAAKPQLLIPRAFDQFDNSMRLEMLGVARRAFWQDIERKTMTFHLNELLHSPETAQACSMASAHFRSDKSLGTICDALETSA